MPDEMKRKSIACGFMCSAVWTRQFFWHVAISYDNSPGIIFPTDPIGASEIFRLRDIPEGKKRRAAIRNWVKEHYRCYNRGTEKEREILIRKHVRGAQTFSWNGLNCAIFPAKDGLRDLKRKYEDKTPKSVEEELQRDIQD